jgi:ATP-dependent DNA helicase RecG
LCEAIYEQLPDDPGMAFLAAQFTNTDRVEYLDKA